MLTVIYNMNTFHSPFSDRLYLVFSNCPSKFLRFIYSPRLDSGSGWQIYNIPCGHPIHPISRRTGRATAEDTQESYNSQKSVCLQCESKSHWFLSTTLQSLKKWPHTFNKKTCNAVSLSLSLSQTHRQTDTYTHTNTHTDIDKLL